jgi:hydrazine synthase alpha subunit-like protein
VISCRRFLQGPIAAADMWAFHMAKVVSAMRTSHSGTVLAEATMVFVSVFLLATPFAVGQEGEDASVPMGNLIESDWIDADAEWMAASSKPRTPFSLTHTRQVIQRSRELTARLAPFTPTKQLTEGLRTLARVERHMISLLAQNEASLAERKALYFDARKAARAIAFANPLLDFDEILFVKRHDAKGVFHMCDQYYGFNAVHGGGLFVLRDPFGRTPQVRDLLASATVENGRLQGRSLEPGAFLSPELSFDGLTILFAYSQGQGKDLEWTPESSFHIFSANADGTGLTQLTDGTTNDFDPCYLPNGRVVFVTERRGGYLRCGRHCPTYTLFSMRPDGSDIQWFSCHETHEWQPSVNHAGMVVYTRWDYVDRDTNVAHHIWQCFPDGRDPRAFHGNYPVKRESRPWMEMSIRAIPGSSKYVATAAAHHGHAFGSLVLIDERLEDDGAESQLTRLTPEVPFPEAEGGKAKVKEYMVYGTPWPLSEDDYLCVYDRHAKNRGIYWIDRFGNKELLYRDPAISSLSPIPLRARTKPPLIPTQTQQFAETTPDQATVGVMNVYQSDFAWPEGSKVAALRILQALPKTTAPPNEPRIGIANQTNARAVLGTVPVESDGSAYFEAPVGKVLYFQALDAKGMAIQSMRSGTYVHPGERLTCQGCHEPKRQASVQPATPPLAMRRAPSPIASDVDGSNPFSYVRLVQPVLDRKCVECHEKKGALDLAGAIEGKHGWTRSYQNLAEKYGFYFHVTNGSINTGVHGGSRTVPGKFGARAAKLLEYMDERHYDVSLTDEEYHRLTLWLDSNSEFYGAYENTQAQARGEIVFPAMH